MTECAIGSSGVYRERDLLYHKLADIDFEVKIVIHCYMHSAGMAR